MDIRNTNDVIYNFMFYNKDGRHNWHLSLLYKIKYSLSKIITSRAWTAKLITPMSGQNLFTQTPHHIQFKYMAMQESQHRTS